MSAKPDGDITNLQAKTGNPQDPKLMKYVERKHRQEVKMSQVQDDFHSKEVTTYQNMRHLVNDVKYVQQHILKLYDLLRQISGNVCDAFPPGGPIVGAPTALLPAGNDAETYAFIGPGSEAHYSDQLPQHESRPLDGSDAHIDEGGNQIDGPHPYGNMDRYGERHAVAVNQSTYNPV